MQRLVLISVLFAYGAVAAQPAGEPENSLLAWNQYYTLVWDDFQGSPDPDARGDAATAVQISARPYMVKKDIRYDVTAFFSRSKSWVRDGSGSLLSHERLHFDIAELYARKIRKKIAEMKEQGINDIKSYNSAINALLQESNDVDRLYDAETLHGALPKRQAQWADRVKEGLAQLEPYSKKRRVIGGR